jgi:hypothetical protein
MKAGSGLHSAAGDGYFESVDGRKSWRRLVDGLEHQYCWSIAISLADSKTLLLSTLKSAYGALYKESANSIIYRRTGSDAWKPVRKGLQIVQIGSFRTFAREARRRVVRRFIRENRMCYLKLRQGPEGRRLNIAQPGRAGYWRVHPSAVGAALYRALPNRSRHTRSQQTLSNETNATESTIS